MSSVESGRFWAKESAGTRTNPNRAANRTFLFILAFGIWHLAVLVHDEVENFAPRADAVERQSREGVVDEVQLGQEVVLVGLDVEDAGRELAAVRCLVQQAHRGQLVGRVVVLGN